MRSNDNAQRQTKKKRTRKNKTNEAEELRANNKFWQTSSRRRNFYREVEQIPNKRRRTPTEKGLAYITQKAQTQEQ